MKLFSLLPRGLVAGVWGHRWFQRVDLVPAAWVNSRVSCGSFLWILGYFLCAGSFSFFLSKLDAFLFLA